MADGAESLKLKSKAPWEVGTGFFNSVFSTPKFGLLKNPQGAVGQ